MKSLRFLVVLGFAVIMSLQYTGCSKMTNPMAPTDDSITKSESSDVSVVNSGRSNPYKSLKISGSWEDTELISWEQGGWLGKRNLAILKIRPKTMSTGVDTEINAKIELTSEGELMFTFGPDELSFSKPARLVLNYAKIEKKLGSLGNGDLTLKWWNPETEEWVVINSSRTFNSQYNWDKPSRRVSFDINHFSIYLISKD